MMFTLDTVVPWGRSLDEYQRMFALSADDLGARILGCADGPASFNAELTAAGGSVASCDPLYRCSTDQIRRRIEQTCAAIIEQTWCHLDDFIWSDDVPNPDALARRRLQAMYCFLDDFEIGRREGRYVAAEVPTLPWEDAAFDLAICSHFLFLYSDRLSADFHVEALRVLRRIAREVRVFPLLELGGIPSRHVAFVLQALAGDGYQVTVEKVDYEFQRGGNQMMRIR